MSVSMEAENGALALLYIFISVLALRISNSGFKRNSTELFTK